MSPLGYSRIAGATSVCARKLPVLAMLILAGLTGCAMDKEGAVRAQLNNWVILGDTSYFNSTWDCTAGVFAVSSDTIKNRVEVVGDIDRGVRMIAREKAVAFEIGGQTPDQVHKDLDKADRTSGVVILVSALAAKECFGDDLAATFFAVLNDKNAVLIYDPENAAVALFDRAGDRLFYARGKV